MLAGFAAALDHFAGEKAPVLAEQIGDAFAGAVLAGEAGDKGGHARDADGGVEGEFEQVFEALQGGFEKGEVIDDFGADTAFFQVFEDAGAGAVAGVEQGLEVVQLGGEGGGIAAGVGGEGGVSAEPSLKKASSRMLWYLRRWRMAPEQPVTRICAAR